MLKSRVTFILLNLALVCALLALEWYQTHGGPFLLPKEDFLFAILAISPLTSILYALVRCRPSRI